MGFRSGTVWLLRKLGKEFVVFEKSTSSVTLVQPIVEVVVLFYSDLG